MTREEEYNWQKRKDLRNDQTTAGAYESRSMVTLLWSIIVGTIIIVAVRFL